MNQFVIRILIGLGAGIVILPMFMGLFLLIKDTLERRRIKKMVSRGEILQPLDKRDYNIKGWEKIIDIKGNEEKLGNLNKSIFKVKGVVE